jgi:hypothetical protein
MLCVAPLKQLQCVALFVADSQHTAKAPPLPRAWVDKDYTLSGLFTAGGALLSLQGGSPEDDQPIDATRHSLPWGPNAPPPSPSPPKGHEQTTLASQGRLHLVASTGKLA